MTRSVSRLFLCILAVALMVCALSVSAFAAGTEVASGYCGVEDAILDGKSVSWSLTDDGVLTISGDGAMKDFEYYYMQPWYTYRDDITSVVIKRGVYSIGSKAFNYCSNITEVIIEDYLYTVSDDAFNGCEKLTRIGPLDAVTYIGDWAFGGCSSLKTLQLGKDLTHIGTFAFSGCDSLDGVWVDPANINFASDDRGVLIKTGVPGETSIFYVPATLSGSYTVPDTVNIIGYNTFYSIDGLTEVTIPASVTLIDGYAFGSCHNLEAVHLSEGLLTIGDGAISDCDKLTSITLPQSLTTIGQQAFTWTALESVVIPDSVTTIGEYAFYNCKSLKSVTLSNSLTQIPEGTFQGCPELTAIKIPESVTSIGGAAFYGCTALQEIVIPDSVTSIGLSAFRECKNLGKVVIGNGVTSVSNYAFYKCTYMKKLTLGSSVETIGDWAFASCSFIDEIRIPGSVKSLGDHAFYNSYTAETLILNEGLEVIGTSAFQSCDKIKSVIIPDTVTTIHNLAFNGCNGITNIHIGKGVTNIETNFVFASESLKHIHVDQANPSYSSDDQGALYNKDQTYLMHAPEKITSYVAPETLKTVGRMAFDDCYDLTAITLNEGLTTIEDDAFSYCTSLTQITIPASVTTIGNYVFSWNENLSVIKFRGDAPTIEDYICKDVVATVYYPQNNDTWTAEIMGNYEGTLTWVAYDPANDTTPEPEVKPDDPEVKPDDPTNPQPDDPTQPDDEDPEGGTSSDTGSEGMGKLPSYEILDGANSSVDLSGEEGLVIRVDADKATLMQVRVDEKLVDPQYYTVTEGSTVISFHDAYLAILSVGEHTVEAIFEGGEAKTTFTVEKAALNPFEDVAEEKFFYKPVLWAYYGGVTTGKDATHFNPSGNCTRSQVVTFLWRAAGEPEPASSENPFPDVPEGKFYTKAVLWAVEQGITAGFKDGTFGPNDACTRGQIVTFLWRYFEQPEPASSENPFPDVVESKFYYKAVLWAVENEITGGFKDGTFGPNKTCTRDQIVTFLYRAMVE